MNLRNRLLLRSIAFGAVTKLGGSLMIVAGLPIIARGLTAVDYALFLRAMSVASFVTLLLGAIVAVAVRTLAEALARGDAPAIEAAERDAAGLFLLAMAASTTLTVGVVLLQDPAGLPVILLAIGLSAMTGLLLWADTYLVALRRDHVTSLFQLGSTLAMLILLLAFADRGAMVVAGIYFGVPALGQAGALLHLRRGRPLRILPVFRWALVRRRLREAMPIVGGSIADYVKIFASGLILSHFADVGEYTRYATIVLLIARFANPLTLITRPLMPAYIDALHHRDARWLRFARLAIVALALGGLAGAILGGALMPPGWLRWALPAKLGAMTRPELVCSAVFLWGIGLTTLMNPIYVARRRPGFIAGVNGGFVAIGIVAGSALGMAGVAGGMLASMAITSALTGIVVAVYAMRRLLDGKGVGATDAIGGAPLDPANARAAIAAG